MKFLDANEVAEQLESVDVSTALRQAFAGLAEGSCVQPSQTVVDLPDEAGDTIYYPAVTRAGGAIGVTISPYLMGVAKAGELPVTAYTLLLSMDTGLPILLCDSMPLIALRTGATTALAVARLAGEARRLAVIGAGPIAASHARFASELKQWDSLVVYSPTINDPGSAQRRDAMCAAAPVSGFAGSLEEAVEGAEVVMLCTSSATPVLNPVELRAGVLVTSVSTDGPVAHEVPPAALGSMDVYCDYRATTPAAAGEMRLAAEKHGWSPDEIVADLPELLSGDEPAKPQAERVRFFRSIGLGIEDIAVAALLV